jgi:carbamoyl-phosphate synthase large subunit
MLLSSAGRRVGLIRAFRSSARTLGIDIEIFACDLKPEWSPACLEADFAFAVPEANSPEFVDHLVDFCEQHEVLLVVPTIDTELLALSLARDRFAAIGATVAVAPPDIVRMARDKLATADFLEAAGIPSPRTLAAEDSLAQTETWQWPLLAKPRHGSSSRGIRIIDGPDDLRNFQPDEPYVVQQMLHGREFTVNLFFDQSGALRTSVPHERLKVRGGEVEKGVTMREPVLSQFAQKLAVALDLPFGAMCYQAILSEDGAFSVFEINARFGGGYPLAHQAGATFTRWLIEERLGLAPTANDDWASAVVMLRFDDALYV